MFKKFRNLTVIILACAAVLLLSSCSFLFDSLTDNNEPVESFKPQTADTVKLTAPEIQDSGIKPCFYGVIPEKQPLRPLEQSDRNETVKTQEELIATAMRGWKPVFLEGALLRSLYDSVLKVLNTIILNDMTPYERAHSIYDFIIYYTVYDLELLDAYVNNKGSVTGYENSFGLKGVFNDKTAVCDGFSKAFSLMCSIEGISNVRVTGDALGEKGEYLPHAWNKVLLDGKWYIVDSTYGNFIVKSSESSKTYKEYLTHSYFLISDSQVTHIEKTVESGNLYTPNKVKAPDDYGFYSKEYISGYKTIENFKLVPHNYVFNDVISLAAYRKYADTKSIKTLEIYTVLSEDKITEAVGIHTRCKMRDNVYLILL